MTAPLEADAAPLRPSRIIAEALVERQGPNQILARARRVGMSPGLTRAVVAACCRDEVHGYGHIYGALATSASQGAES
jgi:hypothetical protein